MKTKAIIESCDNPECDHEQVVREEAAIGYHFGEGFYVRGGGGPIPAFYACSTDCVIPAMQAMIDGE